MANEPARTLPNPEDVLDLSTEPPLKLDLVCAHCEEKFSGEFEWAFVNPERGYENDGWDGVVLSRIVTCQKCGAVDDYRVAAGSRFLLMGRLLGRAVGNSSKGRVAFGVSLLWDGSVVQRPTRALARLRQLVGENPNNAEAFRRLGNGCERWGLMGEAVQAWRKAVALNAADVEAGCSIASYLLGKGNDLPEGFKYLRQALGALPAATAAKKELRQWGPALVRLLLETVERTDEPLALMATWSGGRLGDQQLVNVSSVDLHELEDFETLADFVSRPDVLGLALTSELPKESPTILERLLSGDSGGGASQLLAQGAPFRDTVASRAHRHKRRAEKKRKQKLRKASQRRNR
ncbi:MAG: hypothetical protein HYZ28_03805 [Myxococcales bacterium]|nr:hypothetical protein [Myxococcales bacterium]